MRCTVSQFAHLSCHVFVLLPVKAHDTNACISMHAHNVNDWLNTLLLPLKPVSYPTSYWKHNATLKNKVWALRKGHFKVQRSIRARGLQISGRATDRRFGRWIGWLRICLFLLGQLLSAQTAQLQRHQSSRLGGGNGKGWITDVWLSVTWTLESLIWSRCRIQTKLGPISTS